MQTQAETDPEEDAVSDADSHARFTGWHGATLALLAFGYSGYYFCRSNLSVVLPDLIQDLARHGISASDAQVRLGFMASAGTMAYALGKFISGSLADLFGGRRNFLAGMAGSILFTILFVLSGGFPLFTLAWVGNRFFQSLGWVGLVKVASRWFSYSTYGTVMAVLSLSYLFGDAGCRWVMGRLMAHGLGWRGVFMAAAASLAALLLANLLLLRETPEERGLPSPEANPLNVYAGEEKRRDDERVGLIAILRPLLRSFPFWMVCLLSLGTTLLRETFNFWTPTYFVQYVGLTSSVAAERSALFPLFGGISVLVAGVLSDKLGLNGRNVVLVGGMAASTACLLVLARTPGHASQWTPVVLVTLVGFLLLGPYSYLAGAMSLDFGGKRGSATAAGIIDGVGYLAGWLSGDTVARVTVAFGWKNAFLALAGAALLTALVALVLLVHQRVQIPRNVEAKHEMHTIASIDAVFAVLAGGGGEAYFGEPVTVLEHSLQAAWFVRQKNAEASLVVAALLHDLGHLLHDAGEDAATRGVDTHHEELGVEALGDHFPAAVLDPIKLHVAAKRYLCFAEPRYLAALSPASVESLALQGGPMSAGEAEAFLNLPHAREAVTLRHADDAAKVEGLAVPELETYRPLVETLWR